MKLVANQKLKVDPLVFVLILDLLTKLVANQVLEFDPLVLVLIHELFQRKDLQKLNL